MLSLYGEHRVLHSFPTRRSSDLMETVWVFHAEGAHFAGGVFAATDQAEKWIAEHSLTGVLTEYRVGTGVLDWAVAQDRKSTRLNSSHLVISYAVFCLKKKIKM